MKKPNTEYEKNEVDKMNEVSLEIEPGQERKNHVVSFGCTAMDIKRSAMGKGKMKPFPPKNREGQESLIG